MSIINKTTGGGGGGSATASIIVTGLSQTDNVTASKDGTTKQAVWAEHQGSMAWVISIDSFGLWIVTATNGTKTKTQNVLVDAAADYVIPMDYYLVNTDFSYLEDGWSVVGGTLNFGNGVYINDGADGGSSFPSYDPGWTHSCCLEIPITPTSDLKMSWSEVMTSSVNNRLGVLYIDLEDADNNSIIRYRRGDAWAANMNQTIGVQGVGMSDVGLKSASASWNGKTYESSIALNGGTYTITFNSGESVFNGTYAGGLVCKVRIWFCGSSNATYKMPLIRMNRLVVE